ncbi:hypothetical protein [Streptomyces indicus]|uniref:DUF4287 domain-containing protein n=1 Tax=Streptomyces indicus TaxID=417292 RepID=A0A1G9D8Y2_9ACTN|nr:hypothetical protein [Streptomyces indicus]SDK60379.1 hypothetical protein SAMN05421806_10989 [Streptomyces indicus]
MSTGGRGTGRTGGTGNAGGTGSAGSTGSTGKKITEKLSAAALSESTGKDWLGWFTVLDRWGAQERGHTEIARHLREEHGVNGWHAQSITVGYEQERGLREVGQSCDGTWEASASKTVNAPAEQVTDAFVEETLRRRWLPDADFSLRTHRPGKSLTADWDGGTSRISVFLTVKGPAKTQVGVGHHKLADADAVAAYKEYWRERLSELKRVLEAG